MDSIRFIQIHEKEESYKQDVTIRAVLPAKQAFALVGVRGQHVQQIEKDCSVTLRVYPVIGRLVSISGQPENVSKAWTMCLGYLSNRYPAQYTTDVAINFLLTRDLVTLLRDPLETNFSFEYIARTTGTRIYLKEGTLPESTEQIVRVSIPTMEQVNLFKGAVCLLADNICAYPQLAMSPETTYFIPKGHQDDIAVSLMNDAAV
ncbi:hypothetical protein CU097_000420, partial [Rhizopus azygosporus]